MSWERFWEILLGWGFWSRLPGWFITALAASMGAPFWFEMLNKLNAIRSSGTKPKTRAEKTA
jgi:hypothetical protein